MRTHCELRVVKNLLYSTPKYLPSKKMNRHKSVRSNEWFVKTKYGKMLVGDLITYVRTEMFSI